MKLIKSEESNLRAMYEKARKEAKEYKKLNHDNAMLVEKLRVQIMELEQKLKKKERVIKILEGKKKWQNYKTGK